MSDKKELTVQERFTLVSKALEDAENAIHTIPNARTELKKLAEAIHDASLMMQKALGAPGHLRQSDLTKCSKVLHDSFKKYSAAYVRLSTEEKRVQGPILKKIQAAVGGFVVPEFGIVSTISSMLHMGRSERRAYSEDNGASLLSGVKTPHTMTGVQPGAEDLVDLDLRTADPEKVFNHLLWLGQKEARIRQLHLMSDEMLEANVYHKEYVRLMKDLNNLPAEQQLRYVRLFNRQEILNKDKAAAEYQQLLAQTGKADAADRAFQQTDTYRHAQSFHMMRKQMTGTMAFWLHQSGELSTEMLDVGANSVTNRHPHIADLLDREVSRATLMRQQEKAQEELTSTYLNNPLTGKAYALLSAINKDTGDRSPTFNAMHRMLMDFGRENHAVIADEEKYLKRLTACERAAKLYLKTHKPVPRTDNGKARVALAKQIVEFCSAARTRFEDKQREKVGDQITELKAKQNKTLNDLERLARLQKNASTAGINAEIRDVDPPKSWYSKFGRTLGHYVATGLSFVGNMSIGLLGNVAGAAMGAYTYGIKRPIQRLMYGKRKELDLFHPSGERDASLVDDFSKERDAVTGIYTDVRRIPLTWEREIPDDPDQPPTISFRVQQPKPGSAIGLADGEAGHGFICMKYSKINPITGKLQRYETSFGFYPKLEYAGTMSLMAQNQIGYLVPGQMANDEDHTYSVEKTVAATPEQINKMVRYAQVYEEDGYNMISRNCTSFLVDAAQAVGIETGIDFKKVDLTTDSAKAAFGTILSPLVGNLYIAMNADRKALNEAKKDDVVYQRLGQKVVSKHEFSRDTANAFNQRMRGYTPGATGQTIRADAQFTLHNFDGQYLYDARSRAIHYIDELYKDSDTPEGHQMAQHYGYIGFKSAKEFRRQKPAMTALLTMQHQFSHFHNGIKSILLSRITDLDSVNQTLQEIGEYHETMMDALWLCIRSAENTTGEASLEASIRGSRLTKEYIDTMDRFFRVNLRGDDALIEGFQTHIALTAKLQESFHKIYRREKASLYSNPDLSSKEYSQMRDTEQIVTAFYGSVKLPLHAKPEPGKEVPAASETLPHILSALRVFRNLNEYEQTMQDVSTLEEKDDLSEKEEKTLNKLRQKLETVDEVSRSYKYFPMQKRFNVSDLNLLFNTLPKNQRYDEARTEDITGGKLDDPARLLQCLALEHVLGGIMSKLGTELETAASSVCSQDTKELKASTAEHNALLSQLRALPATDPKYVDLSEQTARAKQRKEQAAADIDNARTRESEKFFTEASWKLADAVNEKLQNLSPADKEYLRTMQICIAQRMYVEDLAANKKTLPDSSKYTQLAANELMNTIASTYCTSILSNVFQKAGGQMETDMPSQFAKFNPSEITQQLVVPAFLEKSIESLQKKQNNPILSAPAPAKAPAAPVHS